MIIFKENTNGDLTGNDTDDDIEQLEEVAHDITYQKVGNFLVSLKLCIQAIYTCHHKRLIITEKSLMSPKHLINYRQYLLTEIC